ncbi:MAG: tetratricopeptide repeat protein [Candidatus Odinarchaeota archaeon]
MQNKEQKLTVSSDHIRAILHISKSYQKRDIHKQGILNLLERLDIKSISTADIDLAYAIASSIEEFGELERAWIMVKEIMSLDLNDKDRAPFLYLGSRILSQKRDFKEALTLLNETLAIYRDDGDKKKIATVLEEISHIKGEEGKYEEACKFLDEVKQIYGSAGDKSGEAEQLRKMGALNQKQDEMAKALKSYEEALTIYREAKNRNGEANTLGDIGLVKQRQGNLEEALKFYEEALETYRDAGDRKGEAEQSYNIANVKEQQGNLEEALKFYEEALETYRDAGDRKGEAIQVESIKSLKRQYKAQARGHESLEALQIECYWFKLERDVIKDTRGRMRPLCHIGGEETLHILNEGIEGIELESIAITSGGDLLRFQGDSKWGSEYFSKTEQKVYLHLSADNTEASFIEGIGKEGLITLPFELNTVDSEVLTRVYHFELVARFEGHGPVVLSPGYVTGPKREIVKIDLPRKQAIPYLGGKITIPLRICTNHSCTIDPKLVNVEFLEKKGNRFTIDHSKLEKITVQPSLGQKWQRVTLKIPVQWRVDSTSGKLEKGCPVRIGYGNILSSTHYIGIQKEEFPSLLQPFLEFKNAVGETLSIPMVGREKDKKEMQKFLKGNRSVLFIFGASGVGKTRFVLETLDQSFLETTAMPGKTAVYRVRYEPAVFNSENITEAFQWFITAHRHHLVILLMDDWYEYGVTTVIRLLREVVEQQKVNVKLVITAWESSRSKINNIFLSSYLRSVSHRYSSVISLSPLSESDLRVLLEQECSDPVTIENALKLSKGYPDTIREIIWLMKRQKVENTLLTTRSLDAIISSRFKALWNEVQTEDEREALQLLALVRSVDIIDDATILTKQLENALERLAETELVITEGTRYTFKRALIGDYILRYELLDSPTKMLRLRKWIEQFTSKKPLEICASIVSLQNMEETAVIVDTAVDWFLESLWNAIDTEKDVVKYAKAIVNLNEHYHRKDLDREKISALVNNLAARRAVESDIILVYQLGKILEKFGDLASLWNLTKRMLVVFEKKDEKVIFLDIGGLVKWQQGELETASKLLVSALKIYASTGNREGEARTLNNLGNVRREQGKIAAAVKMFQKAGLIHRQEGNKPGEAAAMVNLAGVKAMQGDVSSAHRLLQNARIINPLLENELGLAETLANIASTKFREGDLPGSLKLNESVLEMLENTGNKTGQARVTGDIALIKRYQGEYGAAYRLHEKTCGLFQELGDRLGEARALNGMGQVKEELRELKEAYRLYEEALAICKEKGAVSGIAACLGNMANVKKKTKKFNEALELYREAMQKFKEIGDRNGEATQLGNMGNIKLVKHDLAGAAGLYQETLEIYQQTGNKIGEGRQLGNLGLVKRMQGQLEEAAGLHEKAVAIQQKTGFKAEEAKQLGNLAAVRRMQDRNEEAYQLFGRARGIFRDIGLRKEEFNCLILMVQLELEDGNASKACKLLEQASLVARQIGYQEGINECAYLKFTNCQ